ncbi:protein SRC2 homolog [Salvia miltiorrhiza]|uniref:protein SRC2 homolog n=1 Tax=Salvia miltiorrhiza TaxID=226208 RepID=UPI0025AC76A7|nr:protein SRC2 homolog [Salvia miltiorrhiza]
MECRKLEIILVSADDLPNIRSFGKMKVYAEISLNGKSETSKRTTVDLAGETNPKWNFPLDYTVNEASLRTPGLELVVKLFCQRTLGDRYIGEVKISVKSLFDSGPRVENALTYAVGTGDGKLNILYSFGNTFMVPEPAFWKKALEVGLVVMVRGTWFLLTGDIGDFS